jgi:hypothetical protein
MIMSKKKVDLETLLKPVRHETYLQQYDYVMSLIASGEIVPMKSKLNNGKKPALPLCYWKILPEVDYAPYLAELRTAYSIYLHVSYYFDNLNVYLKEREDALMLNTFFKTKKDLLEIPVSYNERSFQIFHREKFLTKKGGMRVLKHCGVSIESLNVVKTAEPFAYYSVDRSIPQKMLIIENKDPFCGMREHLIKGKTTLFGEDIKTLIYGAGKRVISSLSDFDVSSEPYMRDERNKIYYYGDLDYEGIHIYEDFAKTFAYPVEPFIPAYQRLLRSKLEALPYSKEKQNKNISDLFFSYFGVEEQKQMKRILESGRYVPQEYLTISDY